MSGCCPGPYTGRIVPPFAGFTEFTASIPKLYFDVKSQEQRIHRICELLQKLICYADMLGNVENTTQGELENLIAEFEKFKESGFLDYYEEQIANWVVSNMPGIIGQAVKMVFFGCSTEGYFTAYIPDSWNEIIFDAGYDYNDKNTYGRLMLEMFVTDTFKVNGKPTDLVWEVQ